ncbi:amidase domain-containing protein [Herbivorax sp. ANBcel31]|uniref:amidase domain-containing protein n=1 Tax=Herbivorax sp. ANBcel31 TaxID=3069754 RepID=UPI0027AE2FF3|nr:amidase domain-containing protein [Herbivorax sp. ANBcel31]MDQ2086538.1 amidase domain-containing protein [Herbivorax sp. ANBcel31]
MYLFLTIKKSALISISLILVLCVFSIALYGNSKILPAIFISDKHQSMIEEIFLIRNKSFLENDLNTLESLYDKNTKLGTWAYEHQTIKMKYLHKWADKQGIVFNDIDTNVVIRHIKDIDSGYKYNFIGSTEYRYSYINELETENLFRIGTYHTLNLEKKDDKWLISKEWYTDPFADSLNLDNIKMDEFKDYVLESKPVDLSNLNSRRISAVEYADRYCGAAANEEYGYSYNKKYKDYNPLGGDCANFASQILYEGAGFEKNYTWRYEKDGSKAWVNAQAFKDYMIYSGRGSLIAKGNYNQVFKASFKLLPGDFVAYEKKGKVTHISVVTGVDSKGYALVNCHNTDRYRVPWDLGWNNKGINFWLVRVNY